MINEKSLIEKATMLAKDLINHGKRIDRYNGVFSENYTIGEIIITDRGLFSAPILSIEYKFLEHHKIKHRKVRKLLKMIKRAYALQESANDEEAIRKSHEYLDRELGFLKC